MNKKQSKLKLLAGVVALAVIIGGAYLLYGRLSSMHTPEITGTKTPVKMGADAAEEFTVYDEMGKEVKLSDMKGKPVVVNMWATWCPPCREELPDFEKMYREVGDEVVFMMINMTGDRGETVEKASGFVRERGYTFPVYYDVAFSAAMTYAVTSVPQTYFIDSEGRIIHREKGMISYDTLKNGIELIK